MTFEKPHLQRYYENWASVPVAIRKIHLQKLDEYIENHNKTNEKKFNRNSFVRSLILEKIGISEDEQNRQYKNDN